MTNLKQEGQRKEASILTGRKIIPRNSLLTAYGQAGSHGHPDQWLARELEVWWLFNPAQLNDGKSHATRYGLPNKIRVLLAKERRRWCCWVGSLQCWLQRCSQLGLSIYWSDASLTIWLSQACPMRQDVQLWRWPLVLCPGHLWEHLLHRRGLIIIHENTGVITCSELQGILVNARRNVRHVPRF
jgi:hypothetical protein